MPSKIIDRKIEMNKWLIHSRWFYTSGMAGIALFLKIFVSFDFPVLSIAIPFLFLLAVNAVNLLIVKIAQKIQSDRLITVLSYWQILYELLFFGFLFYFSGGLESEVALFFLLPIISAGFFYNLKGSIIVAMISGLIIGLIVFFEFTSVFEHLYRHGTDTYFYSDPVLAQARVVSYIIFYIIIGAYSGRISSLLIRREALLDEKTSKLEQESKYRKNEWRQLDKTAKLLVKRDRELLNANREMDKKVKELQRSETAMLKAFSDLKDGKIALELERNRTSAIVENIIDPIIVINTHNKIELLNQSARVVFSFNEDYAEKKILAKNNFSMNNFKSVIGTEYKVTDVTGDTDDSEELTLDIGGSEVTYRVVSAKVVDKNNDLLGIMKIFYNLTREKMLDKLKSEFISIAAHQLRTPLSAIKWVIKMVLDGDAGVLTDEQRQLLKKGYKSNERIITLVNDMLNVSRIEEGRFGYKMEKNDLSKTLDDVLESLGELVIKKSIKLTLDKEADFPLLNFDNKKMTLVIQNLVENAIKYTPDHGKIHITMKKDEQFVKMSIKDNGIGIPLDDQVKLFSKFYRAENALRLQTEGSGLGLFIVRNIIKEHGGDISFESEEGLGTKFTVTLPIDFKQKEDL